MARSYLVALSLTRKLDSPVGLRVASRDVLDHIVGNRISVAADLRLVQLKRTSTVVDAVTGIDKRIGTVRENANLEASSGSPQVRDELVVVEERRDGVVSVVTLGTLERVQVDNSAAAAVSGKAISAIARKTSRDSTTYPASIWEIGLATRASGLATVPAMKMALVVAPDRTLHLPIKLMNKDLLLTVACIKARRRRVSSRFDICLRLCEVFGVGCATARQAMVVWFLDATTSQAIFRNTR
jgi:hypothetical protein